MQYNQIKLPKGSDMILEQIRKQIESGELLPGSRLPTVVELAANFAMGRSTIREALSGLKAMGWIEIRHGGGTFVSKVLPGNEENAEQYDVFYKSKSFQEVLEVRKYIESGCASLAAKRRTDEDLTLLKAILTRMESALKEEDEQLAEQADVDFHLQISLASHNTLLIDLMASITVRLQESMKESRRLWFFAERASTQRLLQEHFGIFEAILGGNEGLASERIMQHIAKVDKVVQQLL